MYGYFPLDLLVLCLQAKLWSIMLAYFVLMILRKMIKSFWVILRMNKVLSINSNLNDETLFRLNKTNKIGDYFTTEIKEREALIKRLNKYIVAFDYTEKILIVLSAANGRISIISFSSIIEAHVWILSASFSVVFSLTTGIMKKLLQTTRNKKRNIMRIVLAKSKLSSIETVISQALIDSEISYKEFKTIVDEKEKDEKN